MKTFQLFESNLVRDFVEIVQSYFVDVKGSDHEKNFKNHRQFLVHYMNGNVSEDDELVSKIADRERNDFFFPAPFDAYKKKAHKPHPMDKPNPPNERLPVGTTELWNLSQRHTSLIEALLFALPCYYESLLNEL